MQRTKFSTVGGLVTAAILSTLACWGLGAGAGAASTPRSITVNPNNVMVNTDTTVIGQHFKPGTTYTVTECGTKNWIAPKNPCNTNNVLTVRTNRLGNFRASMKVEICPSGTFNPPYGEVCYIGVPKPTGVDVIGLTPHAKITVTYP